MINIYCDESCHLQFDNSDIMLMGGLSNTISICKANSASGFKAECAVECSFYTWQMSYFLHL